MDIINTMGMGTNPVRQTVAKYGPKTAEKLKDEFGEAAILSAKDPRVADALEAAKHMGRGVSAKDLGDGWEERMSMLPGHKSFELSGQGPRATRQVLSVDGESQEVTIMATYADGRNRVVDTIRIGTDGQASHDHKSQVDNQG